MTTKTTLFFWLSGFCHCTHFHFHISHPHSLSFLNFHHSRECSKQLQTCYIWSGFRAKLWELTIRPKKAVSRHHHHRCRCTCDETKHKNSRPVSEYNASLILTVGLKGCINFSSVQKAVDAAPDLSTNRTLIIIDSGTYRYLLRP